MAMNEDMNTRVQLLEKGSEYYFSAYSTNGYVYANNPVNFHKYHVNSGDMFDLSSSTFTAPLKGVYEFSFSANSDNDECAEVNVIQNNILIHGMWTKYCGGSGSIDKHDYGSLGSTWLVQLDAGDKIRLKVVAGELWSCSRFPRI